MDAALISAVKQSYGRALANPNLMESFYQKFISSNPNITKKFIGSDLAKQQEVLKQSLSMAILFPQDNVIAKHSMSRVRDSHGRAKLDIAPELYDHWLDALIGVMAESDPEFNAELELKWRELLLNVIEYIRGGY